MRALERRGTVLEFYGGQLAPQDLHEEVPATAGGLEEARVDALALVLDEVEHRLDHPCRCEDLVVVSHPFLGLDYVHSRSWWAA